MNGGREGGREGRKRWDAANEKVGQESGVEKVNNGRTEEIAMEDWPRNDERGRTLIFYIKIKTLSLIK